MDEQVLQLAEQLLATGFLKLSEREPRVITGVAKRTQISRDVNRTFAERQTLGDRLADRVASFGGSWTFIAMCLVALIAFRFFGISSGSSARVGRRHSKRPSASLVGLTCS